ncbi:MAG: cupin domain-containing protein [Ignavibacterium sp.]
MHQKARYYIDKLELKKHPEGGYYLEIYRAGEMFFTETIPAKKLNKKNISTSIYFLLSGRDKSYFHRLKSDEIWHFYDGCDVKLYLIDEKGNLRDVLLGKTSEQFQLIIPKNTWFAAELTDKSSFALVGCTVAPGFDFNDFELAKREVLLEQFPEHKSIINRFTKD